jgi:alanine racemase
MSIKGKISKFVGTFEKGFEPLNVIEISRKNILHNYDLIKKLNPDMNVWPVLKSNAYGHGIANIAEILKVRKYKYAVCDGYFEALKVWEVAKQQVLLIGAMDSQNLRNINFKNIALTVYNIDTVKELGRIGKRIRVHLKVDTGMRRQGVELDQIEQIIKEMKKYRHIELEGVMSHFSNADCPNNSYTKRQKKQFEKAVEIVNKIYGPVKYIHVGASAGSLKTHDIGSNSVRTGLALYGYNPYESADDMYKKFKDLKLSLRMKSRVINSKEIPKNEKVGYGCTYTTKRKTKIGVLPLGYYEGVDRRLSNKGFVKFRNKHVPILGRVSMNLTTIDLTGTKAGLWSNIEVISSNNKDKNSIENIAKLCNTIPYVVLVKLDGATRRVVVD